MGAARLLRGLSSLIDPRHLTVVVNTGDDDVFFGLHVSPDLDTITYTLAGLADPVRGWGMRGDSFRCLGGLGRLYGEPWFQLGDLDLATHIYRTEQLRRGRTLSAVTAAIRRRLGIGARILPMSDDPVRTFIETDTDGVLPFQEYLVRRRARGRVRDIHFRGVARARPAPGVIAAIAGADAILLPPSNPLVSIAPILSVRGVRRALRRAQAPIAAISPLVAGTPIKGPAHRMLAGLGHEVSPVGVARLYADFADIFVLDHRDARHAPRIAQLGLRPVVAETVMSRASRSRALAARTLRELSS